MPLLAEKVSATLDNTMEAIFCFGELLEDRKSGNHFSVVESQLKNALFHLEAAAWKNIVLAYEPVWAIGTGETASPEQAQEMHAFIRNIIKEQYSQRSRRCRFYFIWRECKASKRGRDLFETRCRWWINRWSCFKRCRFYSHH